ncbi:MAG TPA: DNA/RNA non-specific endonuclease [Cyclobacteriaceae bacterium]
MQGYTNYKLKGIPLILFLVLHNLAFAQLIINKVIYKVNFSNALHQPRYVSYKLHKGGGDCDRRSFSFKNDDVNAETANENDYAGSNYDKGHMANAEDFAFDCTKDEMTFRYYNCLPQTVNLNRGLWKRNEADVRKWSQKEKLYIICGGYFTNRKMGNTRAPSYCWKVVQSVKTKKILFCGWFSNTNNAKLDTLSVAELENKLKKRIILLK